MKKKFLHFSLGILTLSALFLGSCSSEDTDPDPQVATCTDGIKNGDETGIDCGGSCTACIDQEDTNLSGSLTEDRTLDGTKSYTLSQTYSVESGAILTIPAGTKITATVESGDNTQTYIVIQKGAKIDVQGTSTSPVIMTSADKTSGDWGGLVIAGNATTTKGVDATAEVGDIKYGGTVDTDNSGSIAYLIIKYAGANISTESQYNGLTLYAVGSGTTIDNIAMIDGDDDGVEFFGGTVSATNIYLENNKDDAVDWTEGWNGTIENTYVLNTKDFSTAVEADKVNGNPKIINFTAISEIGGTALQFKLTSGATITGLSLAGFDTSVDMKDGGPLANVQIQGADADQNNKYLATATVDVASFSWVNSSTVVTTSILSGSVTSDLTLDANIKYYLSKTLSIASGAKLTIPAGTTIVADVESGDETETYIVIQKGATIDIQGTSAAPVIMTSTGETPGDWGGLVIAGNATTSKGVDATAEVGNIKYGGTVDDDSSGSITYLVLKYAGANISTESQYNGLTLYAVGSGTTIDYVALIDGDDDGVEFFGGTVSASNIYLKNNKDDAVDWTEGWNGTITNTYVSHTTAGFSTAVEADKVNNNPKLINFTAVSTVGGTALQFKLTSGSTLTNVHLSGYDTNIDMKDDGPVANVIIDDTPLTTVTDAVFNSTALDISSWTWFN